MVCVAVHFLMILSLPYNDKLKSLCDENDLEFIDHFDSFSLATGEIAETYFYSDKTHLNVSGTRKFLANIDTVCKVAKLANLLNNNAQVIPPKKYFQSSRRGTRPPPRRENRSSPRYCHICTMNNHATIECWFNGRNTGMQGKYNR